MKVNLLLSSFLFIFVLSVSNENDIFSILEKVTLIERFERFLEKVKPFQHLNKNPILIGDMSVYNDLLNKTWGCCYVLNKDLGFECKYIRNIKFDKNICGICLTKIEDKCFFNKEDLKDFYVYRFIGTHNCI